MRKCQVCEAELYPDEGRSFCQDCKGVIDAIGVGRGGIGDGWTRLLPSAERELRAAALARQAERVAREEAARTAAAG